ncbi:MAG: DUF342 domain-containing protein [Candidatus Hydrogenedentales bacterium]|jgi:uncharacterized protein (DUF342 family)
MERDDRRDIDLDGAPDVSFPEARVRVSRDRMLVLLDADSIPQNLDAFVGWLLEQLTQLQIRADLLDERIGGRIRAAMGEDAWRGLVLAEGEHPGKPADGYIEWAGDFFKSGFVLDEETGALNYRKPAAERNVQAGQLLATVHPPQPGVDGVDVYGNRVPGKKGRSVHLRAGRNVRQEDNTYFAMRDGRIQHDRRSVSVDEVLVIRGNVGLKSGDIDHLGTVLIEGDIEPNSVVRATGDIEVNGIVEQADVEAGGNLAIRGGIMGRGEFKIVVEGRIQARYIIDSNVEAGQDIIVEREIVQSLVCSMGTICVPRGRIVGGEAVARAGFIVGQVGSEALVPTLLTAGRDFRLDSKLRALRRDINELFAQQGQLEMRHKFLSTPRRLPMSRPDSAQKDDPAQLKQEMAEVARRIQLLTAEAEELRLHSQNITRARLEILKMVYPESCLRLADEELRVREQFPGPLHARLARGKVHLRKGPAD